MELEESYIMPNETCMAASWKALKMGTKKRVKAFSDDIPQLTEHPNGVHVF